MTKGLVHHISNREKITLKIIMLGSVNVGKTSLIKRYIHDQFITTRPTIGVDFGTKIIESEELILNLQLYDTAGQERYNYQLGSQFYRNADGAVLVYDLSRQPKDSLEQLKKWRDEVLTKSYIAGDNDFKLPIVVVGNKADLKLDVDYDIIHDFCRENYYGHIETSAKESYQVEAAVLAVTSLALTEHRKKKIIDTTDDSKRSSINLSEAYTKKKEKSDCGC